MRKIAKRWNVVERFRDWLHWRRVAGAWADGIARENQRRAKEKR